MRRLSRGAAVILIVAAAVTAAASSRAAEKASPVEGLDVPEKATIIFEDTYRLLVNVFVQPDGGLRVTSLAPNTPTTNMTLVGKPNVRGILEVDDVITHVNDVKVKGLKDYYDAMDKSGGDVTLRIIDKRTRQPFDWKVAAAKVRVPVVPEREKPADKRVARVLLIGLTDDNKIGESIGKSLTIMEEMFRNEIPKERLDLEVVSGKDCDAPTIIAKVKKLGTRAKDDDSIVVYYLGHGAYDPRFAAGDPSGGHFFQIPGGDLMRKTLFDNMLAQPGRLKVLITDTCNVKALTKVPKDLASESTKMTVTGPTNLEQLLLYHRGYLDVSASSRDQFSWFSFRFGGWFSFKFAETIPNHADWPTFLDRISRDANAFFLENRQSILDNPTGVSKDILHLIGDQKEMKPAVFQMSLARDGQVPTGPSREISRVVTKLVPK